MRNTGIKGIGEQLILQVITHSSVECLYWIHFEYVSINALLVPSLNSFTTPMNKQVQFTIAVIWEHSNNTIPHIELVVTSILIKTG